MAMDKLKIIKGILEEWRYATDRAVTERQRNTINYEMIRNINDVVRDREVGQSDACQNCAYWAKTEVADYRVCKKAHDGEAETGEPFYVQDYEDYGAWLKTHKDHYCKAFKEKQRPLHIDKELEI